jgi:hypothetical protein
MDVDAGGYVWTGPEPAGAEGFALADEVYRWVDKLDAHAAFSPLSSQVEQLEQTARFVRRLASTPGGAALMLRTLKGWEREGQPVTADWYAALPLRERLGPFFAACGVWVRLGLFDFGPSEKIAEAAARRKAAGSSPLTSG